MGMDQRVTFAGRVTPSWEQVRDLLAARGFAVQLRMIDGQLAFPDEQPPRGWRELRVGTPQGMVTLRRDGDELVCVTWGNADASLRQAWNALAWASAECGGGRIQTPQGEQEASAFLQLAELPPLLRI
jgi:hypothetical protein